MQGPFRSPLFAVGLGSSPRTEGLGGRPGGGGGEERGSVWVSRGIRTVGVAKLSLRGRCELSPPCVRNYQVITDDLHLKEGAVERKKLYFYRPLPGLLCRPYYSLPSAFFLSPVRVYCRVTDSCNKLDGFILAQIVHNLLHCLLFSYKQSLDSC